MDFRAIFGMVSLLFAVVTCLLSFDYCRTGGIIFGEYATYSGFGSVVCFMVFAFYDDVSRNRKN